MKTIRADALVIGSGFGGAAPALRLAEAGMRVRMIEKGESIGIRDFRQTQDPRYVTRFIRGLSGDHLSFTYAEALGGGSGFYEMVSLRAPSLAFETKESGGRPLWPDGVDRATMDPWYDMAEEILHVEQIAPESVPRSGLVFSLLMKNLGFSCDRARYAVRGCLGSGFCVTGCVYGAKQSLHLNYLPRAVEAGAIIDCDLEALRIEMLPGARKYHVYCRERTGDKAIRRYESPIVVLAGGTVGTATLLLASRNSLRPLSPALGRHICINGGVKVAAMLPDDFPDGDMFAGRSHPGMISYHFLESHGITISAVKAMPIQAITAARFRLDGDPREPAWWGEANVELMRRFRHRVMALTSFGLTPPCAELSLPKGGGPVLSMRPTAALQGFATTTRGLLESILLRNGCRLVHTDWVDRGGRPHEGLYFSTSHQTGSARMAETWEDGVVNSDGAVFRNPGLYVTDGAAIPSSLAVNTSLTILANAERIAAKIVASR